MAESIQNLPENSKLIVFLLSFQTSTNDHKRIRCVSVTILTVIVIIIGGIVGILMGLLD